MFDLDTLHYLNEQAHQEAVERANQATEKAKQAPVRKAPVWPLSDLARRMLVGPPSLVHLIDLFGNSEVVKAFVELVREFLPEHEAEIMSLTIDGRQQKFTQYFGQRYFPLADQVWDEIDLEGFVNEMPVELMGFSYDDYHMFEDFRPGYILLLSLVVYPYIDGYENKEEMEACSRGLLMKPVGGRVPILEEAGRLVGDELAGMIPPSGWRPEDLHQMTDGTNYEGCGDFANWICSCTGCMVLDTTYDDYGGEAWDKGLVEELTQQWPKVREIQMKIAHLVDWLEDDPKTNFRELMAFLLKRKDMIVPKEQLPLPLDEKGQVKAKTLMEIFDKEEVATDGEENKEDRFRPATRADIEALTHF